MPMVSKYNFWEQKVSIYIEHFKHEGFIKKNIIKVKNSILDCKK